MKGAPGVKVVVVVTSSGGKGKGERGGEKREEKRGAWGERQLGEEPKARRWGSRL
jgi:hypothetical protein